MPEAGLYLPLAMYATGNHLVERQLYVDGELLADLVFGLLMIFAPTD